MPEDILGPIFVPGSNQFIRKSFNANASPITPLAASAAGLSHSQSLCQTALPKLVAAESGSGTVSNPGASSFVARGGFQITALPSPAPAAGAWFTALNLRNEADGTYASNLGYWYMEAMVALRIYTLNWIYAPYNNIPSSPFVEIGDGSTFLLSMDILLPTTTLTTSGTITNAWVEADAGNFYVPQSGGFIATSKIGNSVSTGPIGTL